MHARSALHPKVKPHHVVAGTEEMRAIVAPPMRVLLVDDSSIARAVIGRIIAADARFSVCAAAESAQAALDVVDTLCPNIIILDIEMPGMSGLELLPLLIQKSGAAPILILSSVGISGGAAAVQALALGASAVMSKPGRTRFSGDFATKLCATLANLCIVQQHDQPAPIAPFDDKAHIRGASNVAKPDATRVIAIGASTGGIPAIHALLEHLDNPCGCPIFITQHLPVAFMRYFADQIASMSGRNVKIAANMMPIAPDVIYIAPGNADLLVSGHNDTKHILLGGAATEANEGASSIDRMFIALADCYGSGVQAIVLSGMGRDGAIGARHIRALGGSVFAQDKGSAAIWGMPGAVTEAGLATAVLPPESIARRLISVAMA